MERHEPFGEVEVPYAEPGWYRGLPTPFYRKKHAAFRAHVRKFIEEELRPYTDEWDEAGDFPLRDVARKAYAAGVLTPWAPKELGGKTPEGGWDEFMNVVWIDEVTRSGSAGVNIVTFFITMMSLPHTLIFGSDFLKQEVAIPVIRGDATMCITLTEPAGGSDLANLKTEAILDAKTGMYSISGQKKFITGGMNASFFSSLVRTGGKGLGGLSIIVIQRELPGITVRKIPTQGWWAGNTTLVTFDNVQVPAKFLIGEEGMGFQMMAQVMNSERMIAVVGATRGARICMAEAIKYARQRTAFGKPLVKNQVITHKIATMARLTEAAQSMTDQIAACMEAGCEPFEVGGQMALLKVQATQALEYSSREASQIFGGNSFVRGGKGQVVERIAREVRVACVGGGSEEVMIDLGMRMAKL